MKELFGKVLLSLLRFSLQVLCVSSSMRVALRMAVLKLFSFSNNKISGRLPEALGSLVALEAALANVSACAPEIEREKRKRKNK